MATYYIEARNAAGAPFILTVNDADAEWIATAAAFAAPSSGYSDYDAA